MKKNIVLATFTILFLGIASTGFGQVELGLHGSRLNGTDRNQWGGGVFLKFLVQDHLALGGAVRYYPKNLQTTTVDYGGGNIYKIRSGDVILPVTGSVDYYFGKSPVRPYIGTDLGVYFTKYIYDVAAEGGNSNYYSQQNNKAYFGAAPRAGISVELGPIGIFGQAGYNYLFGSGNQKYITIPGISEPINSKPSYKFWTYDLGVSFKFGS